MPPLPAPERRMPRRSSMLWLVSSRSSLMVGILQRIKKMWWNAAGLRAQEAGLGERLPAVRAQVCRVFTRARGRGRYAPPKGAVLSRTACLPPACFPFSRSVFPPCCAGHLCRWRGGRTGRAGGCVPSVAWFASVGGRLLYHAPLMIDLTVLSSYACY